MHDDARQTIHIRVLLFAAAAEAHGQTFADLDLPPGSTIGQLRKQLAAQAPALAPLLPQMLFAVDQDYASDEQHLTTGSEVACIPPVSGG
jgi:molybdopterin converting factor subunit 1